MLAVRLKDSPLPVSTAIKTPFSTQAHLVRRASHAIPWIPGRQPALNFLIPNREWKRRGVEFITAAHHAGIAIHHRFSNLVVFPVMKGIVLRKARAAGMMIS